MDASLAQLEQCPCHITQSKTWETWRARSLTPWEMVPNDSRKHPSKVGDAHFTPASTPRLRYPPVTYSASNLRRTSEMSLALFWAWYYKGDTKGRLDITRSIPLSRCPAHLHLGARPPRLRGGFGVRVGGARQRCGRLLTSAMVAVVDVIAVAVATSTTAVRLSHHRASRPGGKEGRAGGGGGRVTTEGGQQRRRAAQSGAAAWEWRRDQALNLASHSLLVRAPPPDVSCTADPPPPTGG